MLPIPMTDPPEPNTAAPVPPSERRPGLTPFSLFLVLLVAYLLIQIKLVLILTLLAILFATLIEGPLQQLERRRVPRPLGIVAIYVAILATVGLLSFLIAPPLANQARAFARDAPGELRDLEQAWRTSRNPILSGPGEQLLNRASLAIDDPPVPQGTAIGLLAGIGGGIAGALTLFVIAFYYLMEKSLLRRLILLEVRADKRARVNRVWDLVEAKVGDWLRGQLTLCLIIGVTATIGYGILQVRFWPLLGLVAGITELIPIVGPWLGGIPAVIVALTQSWQKALLVTGFIVLLQLMENTVLVPRVMRGAVGLTPLTVFVAILAGAEFMGPAGALLAIPIAGVVQVLFGDYLNARREANRISTGTSGPAWRWMRGYVHPAEPHPTPVDQDELYPPPDAAPTGARARPRIPTREAPGWTGDLIARAGILRRRDGVTPPSTDHPAAESGGAATAVATPEPEPTTSPADEGDSTAR